MIQLHLPQFHVICIYLRILVVKAISPSDDNNTTGATTATGTAHLS
jgi:hypothetical protein